MLRGRQVGGQELVRSAQECINCNAIAIAQCKCNCMQLHNASQLLLKLLTLVKNRACGALVQNFLASGADGKICFACGAHIFFTFFTFYMNCLFFHTSNACTIQYCNFKSYVMAKLVKLLKTSLSAPKGPVL